MIVRRGCVLEDALRRVGRPSFDPARSIVVCYCDKCLHGLYILYTAVIMPFPDQSTDMISLDMLYTYLLEPLLPFHSIFTKLVAYSWQSFWPSIQGVIDIFALCCCIYMILQNRLNS